MSANYCFGGDGKGKLTQTAGTAIVVCCEAKSGAYTNVLKLANTVGGTAHTIALMRDASGTTLSSSAAASQAVANVTAALTDGGGNAIASGDYVAVQKDDTTWHVATFTSAATLAYTLGTNFASAASAGNKVFCYGVVGDSFHTNYQYAAAASAQLVLPSGDVTGCLVRGRSLGAPVLCYNANATAASTLDYIMWGYSKK